MTTTDFSLLPLEAYLNRNASKERRALHEEAFSRRIAHWKYSVKAVGLDEANAAIQQQFDTTFEDLKSSIHDHQLQCDIQLEIVLALEAKLEQAGEAILADQLAREIMLASCELASYQVALHQSQKRLRHTQAILGDKQQQAEAFYAELLGMDEVVQLREQVRVELDARRSREAQEFRQCIGSTPSEKLRQEILAADLGEHEQKLIKALDLHANFKKQAAYKAYRMAEDLRSGQSPYLAEAPPNSDSFAAFGSYVRAFDRHGNTVARWAVASDGGAYLLKVLQPAGTRRIRRRGYEIKAFGEGGQVLASYPNTAWLMRRPMPTATATLAA